MADYFYTRYIIGGEIDQDGLEELTGLLRTELQGFTELDVREAIKEKRPLEVVDEEARWGEIDGLFELCQGLGLTVRQETEPKYEYSGEVKFSKKGMAAPLTRVTNADMERTLMLNDLRAYQRQGYTLEALIHELETDPATAEEIPPLTLKR